MDARDDWERICAEKDAEMDKLHEREIWRQYACAALAGYTSRASLTVDPVLQAAETADEMLILESERFGDKEPG